MQTIKSAFLLIGQWPQELNVLDPIRVKNLDAAMSLLKKQAFQVVGLHMTSALESSFDDFYSELQKKCPWATIILSYPQGFPAKKMLSLHSQFHFFRILPVISPTTINQTFLEALEKSNLLQQDSVFEELIRSQEREQEIFHQELERRIIQRTEELAEKRFSLHTQTLQLEILKDCLLAIQSSASIAELESILNNTLAKSTNTLWVRIIPSPLDKDFSKQTELMKSFHIFEKGLFKGQKKIGTVFFLRSNEDSFQKTETRLFSKIAEAIALSVDKLIAAQNSEEAQSQWMGTFASIQDPIAIIDQNYNVIQANNADAASEKCYKWKFGRTLPCPFCQRGSDFRLRDPKTDQSYKVYSQSVQISPVDNPVYFNMYHDITEEVRLEQAVFDSAQRSELGLISSSIAHELNNPLSGILTYSQLLSMELPADHPLKTDLALIEDGAKRSQKIITDLLSFSRIEETEKSFDLEKQLSNLELQNKKTK